jgi:hypothetical protein
MSTEQSSQYAHRPTGTQWRYVVSEVLTLMAEDIRAGRDVAWHQERLTALVGFAEEQERQVTLAGNERDPQLQTLIDEREGLR